MDYNNQKKTMPIFFPPDLFINNPPKNNYIASNITYNSNNADNNNKPISKNILYNRNNVNNRHKFNMFSYQKK